MNRSRLVFVIIVGAALLLVGGGVLLDQLNSSDSNESTDNGPADTGSNAVVLSVAVSPLAFDWIDHVAQTYNNAQHRVDGQRVTVSLTRQDSLPIWNTPGEWSVRDHPQVWIADSTRAVEYANEVGMSFAIQHASLASTVMVWGAPADRALALSTSYGQLDWHSVQQACVALQWSNSGGESGWGFVKPGFAQPGRYTSGLTALFIATAEFHQSAALSAAQLNDPALIEWLKPVFESVPNFASLGMYPAQSIATRGTSVADLALLPENEWLMNYQGLTSKVGPLTFVYPTYQFWFDFPFAVWDSATTTDSDRAAAADFLQFLLEAEQQRQAAESGLRQPDGTPAQTTLFDQAASAGITLNRPVGESIQLPSRNGLTPFTNRDWTAF